MHTITSSLFVNEFCMTNHNSRMEFPKISFIKQTEVIGDFYIQRTEISLSKKSINTKLSYL